ncbi:hypothetical protein Q1695_011588 [Nippostrongylus brasiliensis]|nr:hypothetical protein Q1695_011588 [Nippostrongylus brasiliensis]
MGHSPYVAVVLLMALLPAPLLAQDDDDSSANSVSEEPYVNCAADAIYVKLKTAKTFEGHVHLKFTNNKLCYQVLVTNNQIEVLIPHEECGVTRRRSKSPPGVFLEASLAVSFHRDFTTADDRIFHFRCFHQRTNTHDLQSTGSPTEPPRDSSKTPTCSYTVRKWMNGPLVGTVALGQVVFHQWSCEDEKERCLIVRGCSVVGSDAKHELIGADGCSRNPKILPNLRYISPSLVGQNVSVFGIAQTSLIYFECDLILLPRSADGQCEVPECAETTNRTRRSFEADDDVSLEVQSQRIEVSELGAILDGDSEVMESVELTCQEKANHTSSQICVAFNPFIIFLAGMISMVMFAAFVAVIISLQRYRHYTMSQTNC